MENNSQAGINAFLAGRTADALLLLQAAVQENPQDAEARKFLGAALAQSGRPAEAVEQLRQAVQLSPQNAQIHYNLGVAQTMSGDSEGAKNSYYTALKLNPQYDQARTALTQMGAPLPAVSSVPAASNPTQSGEPFHSTGAMTTHGPPVVVQKPSGADYFKALVSGGIAALVGAFIWDKFVYYTKIEFGLISVGIGILVGLAVTIAAGGRRSKGLQILSGLLALWGMLLGYALLVADEFHLQAASNPQLVHVNPLLLLIVSFGLLPTLFQDNPLSLAFVAFGVYEGWKIPGNHAATPAPQPAPPMTTAASTAEPPKPLE